MSPDDASEFDEDEDAEEGCGHGACRCAAGESGYCSDFCEQHEEAEDEDTEERCGCGHPDCAAE